MRIEHDKSEVDRLSKDVNLVARAQRGDRQALEELMTKYRSRVYGFCYRFVQFEESATETAEDLVQEIFVKVSCSLGNFKAASSFTTWLYRIASNHCLDYKRQKQRVPEHESLDAPAALIVDERSCSLSERLASEDCLYTRVEIEAMWRFIAERMPPDLLKVLTLASYEWKYSEIAKLLNVAGTPEKARETINTMLRKAHKEALPILAAWNAE